MTGLVDLYGNEMTEPFVRHFTIKGVEGYVLESRSNDTLATATNLPLVASGFRGRAMMRFATSAAPGSTGDPLARRS